MSVDQEKLIEQQFEILEILAKDLQKENDYSSKLAILNQKSEISQFLKQIPELEEWVEQLNSLEKFVIKSLVAIGQGPVVFQDFKMLKNPQEQLDILLQQLLEIEKFYNNHGGIIGYHALILKLIESKRHVNKQEYVTYRKPKGIDISKETAEVKKAIRSGLESMDTMIEMYPLGGAGDRLKLQDEKTGELLPAAQLLFGGRSLLETLIRDLQGREYLHFKLFGTQLVTPLAIMTSHEKKNHQRILELCEINHWFGRPKESYRFFIQPLVPMVTLNGEWAISAPLKLILKPGGHGVIWKAALDEGIFDWFESLQKKKVMIRQINNPIAGVDTGLLAFSGIGCQKNKDFGFASCERRMGASEGMDVLRETKIENEYQYVITNIEYTEFKRCGIEDIPMSQESSFSCFPANTNILFGDLKAIREVLDTCSIPGMLINFKSQVRCYSPSGSVEKHAGRLESTMQNIADFMMDKSNHPKSLNDSFDDLRTFLTFNERRKTISVTKQSYVCGKSLTDTPEGCFFDLQQNYRDLLINHCEMVLPLEQDGNDYLINGPDTLILFHPALGPLYSVIGQKIKGGKLCKGAEWILEIAEFEAINLHLNGSLIVESDSIMGKKDSSGVLKFEHEATGKCSLINVKVRNQGRVRSAGKNAWKCQTTRTEALKITLNGNAEFFAENVLLDGNIHFDVPNGQRLIVYQQAKEIAWHFETISNSSWKWNYFFDTDASIRIKKA